jgi:hypothetical protein
MPVEAKKGGGGVAQTHSQPRHQKGGVVSNPPRPLYLQYKPGTQCSGWASGPIWTNMQNLAPHRAFIIYRPVILDTTVTVNTAVHPTFSILQIFIDVKSDKECYSIFIYCLPLVPYK